MKKQVACDRCEGKGYLNGFSHVRDGVCFKCAGTGTTSAPRHQSDEAKAKAAAKRAATADARRAKAAADRKAGIEKQNAQIEEARRKSAAAYQIYKDHPRVKARHITAERMAQDDGIYDTL